ncbi:MAG: hypothetical protein AAFN93_30320, partial [Bacteroidota bacterium]
LEQLQLDGELNFSGTITFTGSTITDGTDNAITLGTADITIAGNVQINGDDNVLVNGDFTVNSGTFVLGTNVTLTGTAGNNFTVQAAATIRLFGADNFPTGFATYNFPATNSRALYDANLDQVVRGVISYGELELGGGGIKTADGNIDINGVLDLNAGVDFVLGAFSHTLAGNVQN